MGQRIAVERARRWPTRAAFARAAGLSYRTIDDLETGRRTRFRADTLGRVERALTWEPGTIIAMVEGGRVGYDLDADLRRIHDAWPRLHPDARAMLADLAERRSQ